MRESKYEQKVYADKIKLFDILIMAVLKAVYFPVFVYAIWAYLFGHLENNGGLGISLGMFIALSFLTIKPIKNYIAYREKFPM